MEQLLRCLFTSARRKHQELLWGVLAAQAGQVCSLRDDFLVSHKALSEDRALLLPGNSSELSQPWNGQSEAGGSSCVRRTAQQGTQGHRFRSGHCACAV